MSDLTSTSEAILLTAFRSLSETDQRLFSVGIVAVTQMSSAGRAALTDAMGRMSEDYQTKIGALARFVEAVDKLPRDIGFETVRASVERVITEQETAEHSAR